MLSSSITRHSKTQSPLRKSAKQIRADKSATTHASRQSWPELAYRRAFIQLAAFSKRKKKRKSTRQICTTHKACDWSWCNAGRTHLYFQSQQDTTTLFFLSVLSIYFIHACDIRVCFPGAWSSWVLASRQFAPKSWTSLSAYFAFCAIYILHCEQEQRRKVNHWSSNVKGWGGNRVYNK